MNTGKWIVVSFVLFAGFIGTLVTLCMRQNVSLVSEHYYQEELQYQDRINQEQNTSALAMKPGVKIVNHQLAVTFPDQTPESATLTLFCPANEKMDRNFKFPGKIDSITAFNLTGLQPGLYRARLQWTTNEKVYYQEEIINL